MWGQEGRPQVLMDQAEVSVIGHVDPAPTTLVLIPVKDHLHLCLHPLFLQLELYFNSCGKYDVIFHMNSMEHSWQVGLLACLDLFFLLDPTNCQKWLHSLITTS